MEEWTLLLFNILLFYVFFPFFFGKRDSLLRFHDECGMGREAGIRTESIVQRWIAKIWRGIALGALCLFDGWDWVKKGG